MAAEVTTADNYAACFVQSGTLTLNAIKTALGVEADFSHQRGDVSIVSPGGVTHRHRRSTWELREPIHTSDAMQGAVDRILQRWPSIAEQEATPGDQVESSALDVKLEIETDLDAPYRFRLTHDQLRLLADTTGINVGVYDSREDPGPPAMAVTPPAEGTKRVGLVAADGVCVLQHAALPECDTWTLVNTAMLGVSRWFVWDADRLRAQRPTAFVVRLPLHHDAHWDTGFSLDAEEIRILVELDVVIDVIIWTLP